MDSPRLQEDLNHNLIEACKVGSIDDVKVLILAKADINHQRKVDGSTPLMLAAMFSDRIMMCDYLIKAKANVLFMNNNSRTALQIAAWNFNTEICDLIVQKQLRILSAGDKPIVYAFLYSLRNKHKDDYPNLKNIFKNCMLEFIEAKNRPKILAELRAIKDYGQYMLDRYSSPNQLNKE